MNIADLFEHAVDAAPDNPALKVGDRVMTYAELEADANRLELVARLRRGGSQQRIRSVADDMGVGDTFVHTPVGVWPADPGSTAAT